jgi:hypothetical protein
MILYQDCNLDAGNWRQTFCKTLMCYERESTFLIPQFRHSAYIQTYLRIALLAISGQRRVPEFHCLVLFLQEGSIISYDCPGIC